jgi:nitrogen fixation-related uncharacterized protein
MTDSNVAFGLLTSLVPLVVMLVLIIVPVALFIWAVKKFTNKRKDDKNTKK